MSRQQTPLEALHNANRDLFPLDTPRQSSWLFWTVLVGALLAAGIWIYRNF